MVTKGSCSPLLKCESLALDTYAYAHQRISPPWNSKCLGKSSSHLETLVITMSPSSLKEHFWDDLTHLFDFAGENSWTSQKRSFQCLMIHLKIVEFADLKWYYRDFHFSFVQFLLKNARVLRKG